MTWDKCGLQEVQGWGSERMELEVRRGEHGAELWTHLASASL